MTESDALVPKYYRIQRDLLDRIRNHDWLPGAAIPSETDLCKQYQVSRGTVRRALDELDRQGLIIRSPGRPTIVNTPKIPLLSSGFRTDIAKKGMVPGTEVLTIGYVKAPLPIAELLDVDQGVPVLAIERVITADGVPIIIETAHIARDTQPIEAQEVKSRSLLELIPEKCGVYLTRAVESYEPIRLSASQARLLHCRAGDLAIQDQALLFDSDQVPLYVSTAVVRGDKARILTETSFNVHR
ncbi:GntR family transcriptional regulator [Sulfobacillus harzensis]|uniref:GntR family transcriptional regulator n=1 Tax=Sulfobacillus harzensis TaxID=2729629 RepID=A0A7Y0L494_9FIRM|nr:GntR family transcriptional regulator [Sulfobacillus harzensis]NMP22945.1 GntR family transcriptional regulator [Sulfobacillus harzensis]